MILDQLRRRLAYCSPNFRQCVVAYNLVAHRPVHVCYRINDEPAGAVKVLELPCKGAQAELRNTGDDDRSGEPRADGPVGGRQLRRTKKRLPGRPLRRVQCGDPHHARRLKREVGEIRNRTAREHGGGGGA